jgi:hypothetical protein
MGISSAIATDWKNRLPFGQDHEHVLENGMACTSPRWTCCGAAS